jgi:hypothetical protein
LNIKKSQDPKPLQLPTRLILKFPTKLTNPTCKQVDENKRDLAKNFVHVGRWQLHHSMQYCKTLR